jgi:succinyl-CoA synthetase beta subunit
MSEGGSMVNLYEYEGKRLFRANNIPVPAGEFAKTPEEAEEIAKKLGRPIAAKAQVLTGGRGKAGGIKFAERPDEVARTVEELMKIQIKGQKVHGVLIEEKLNIAKEYYAGIIVDDAIKAPVLLFSTYGGMEIENIAEKYPEKIVSIPIKVLEGMRIYHIRNLVRKLEKGSKEMMKTAQVIFGLYEAYRHCDATLMEINPLALTEEGKIVAADARVQIDYSALARHAELDIRDIERHRTTERSLRAWYEANSDDYRGTWYYMQLIPEDVLAKEYGYIGFHAVGGGESMLSMDALNRVGLKIANYCDTSGSPPASKIYRASKIILSQPNIEGYFFISCIASQPLDITARGLVKALIEIRPKFPVLVRIAGNREKEAHEILRLSAGLLRRVEIYGREVDEDFCARRMKELVQEFRGTN